MHLDALGKQPGSASGVVIGASGPDVLAYVAQRAGLLQNDAFLLFRALCKLSIRTLPEPDSDEVHVRFVLRRSHCFHPHIDWCVCMCVCIFTLMFSVQHGIAEQNIIARVVAVDP